MCIFQRPKNQALSKDIAAPEATAEAAAVGSARKKEDKALFGGVPNLRVDRSSVKGGVGAGGSGLKVM